MKKNKWFWLAVYLILFVACILIIYVAPSFLGLFERTYNAEYGELSVVGEEEGYIVRNDTVYLADKAGKVNRLAKEGELVKGNSRIVEVTGEGNDEIDSNYSEIVKSLGKDTPVSSNGVTANNGYVSYFVDGFEKKMSGATINDLTKDQIGKFNFGKAKETPKDKCAKGEPLFKITTNGDWWVVFYTSKEDAKKYTAGNSVTIKIDNNESDGEVVSLIKERSSGKYRVIIKSKTYFKEYLSIRKTKVSITTVSTEGVLVRSDSIIKKKGVKGVLVKNKIGDDVFTPVMVKADDGKNAAVYEDYFADENGKLIETISIYDEIVKSPSKSEIKKSKDIK